MPMGRCGYRDFVIKRFKAVKLFFIIFYTAGVVGLVWPFTFPLFLQLTPLALLLSFIALVLFHPAGIDKKTVAVFLGIYAVSFIIEAVGVNTHLIFGPYGYGQSLGYKLFGTPVIIGLNWLLLVYTTASVAAKTAKTASVRIVLAAMMMVLYDLILEPVAPQIDMWYWQQDLIPFQNYAAWFVIALFFHYIMYVFGIRTDNRLAPVILVCQSMFFLSIGILLQIFP